MLPNIKSNIKPYIYYFLQKYRNKVSPYSVEHIRKNRLVIRIAPTQDVKFKRFNIIVNFDEKDNVITVIDTDDEEFYVSLFYMEVIRKKRDNEAWQIIKARYNDNIALEKYVYFLLNAPQHIIDLIE